MALEYSSATRADIYPHFAQTGCHPLMNTEFNEVLESVRRGEVVRIVSDLEASQPETFEGMGQLALAAERASIAALTRLLRLSNGPPTFVTTRDRLEQLQIVAAPFLDGEDEDHPNTGAAEGEWSTRGPAMATQLALAASSLIGGDPEQAGVALRGSTVRCTDWGGVVNCQRVFEAAVDLSRLAGLIPGALICRSGGERAAAVEPWARDESRCLPTVTIRQIVDYRRERATSTLLRTGPRVRMPTRHGNFSLQGYEDTLTGQLHLALWTGAIRDPTLVRVHSECMTGDLLGSLRCDCGPQLDRALARLAQEGSGVLLYMRQEGRGIGLINKLRTYSIQDKGFDTVEANEQIGFKADLRDYSLAAQILVDLGISTIRLLTNNPRKVRGLKKHGIRIAERVPLVIEACSENSAYLDVKQKKLGHWLS
jgi:3,4-dihydroxy 2-butanone 4-phosphate synthase/GTP cyclohydrolase II